MNNRLQCVRILALSVVLVIGSSRFGTHSSVHAEVREAYLFALSGPLIALILGVVIKGAITAPEPDQSIKPELHAEDCFTDPFGANESSVIQTHRTRINAPGVQDISRRPLPPCNRYPRP